MGGNIDIQNDIVHLTMVIYDSDLSFACSKPAGLCDYHLPDQLGIVHY